jgi:AAA domain-containing protein
VKPPARAVVGNLVWSTDAGTWAVWRVEPFAYGSIGLADKLGVHNRLRGMLMALPQDSMLLSIAERIDPDTIVEQMTRGIDLDRRFAWAEACIASSHWLNQVALRRRRYYLVAALPRSKRAWHEALRAAGTGVNAAFGIGPLPIADGEVERAQAQAQELQYRLAPHLPLASASAGEICWLYARSLRRGLDEPYFDDSWEPEPPLGDRAVGRSRGRGRAGGRGRLRPEHEGRHDVRRVLAHLTDVVVKEGGDKDDDNRPRHRRYVRIDSGYGSSYQTVLAMSDMPHRFWFPDGGGEWLHHADQVGFPVDWCVRIKAIRNADAQLKARRKHRDLIGQLEQYDGEVSGAPPQLADAIEAMDEERAELGANPAESELQVSVLLSLASDSLAELEERAGALQTMFEPQEYGLARPTGGQSTLLRATWPGSSVPAVARDYTQFMLARDLAAGAPYCRDEIGDPHGLLLAVSLAGNETPVMFDPAYGPQVNASPSLGCVGRLGSGKSFFLKRLCWDTLARGGQVVTIDRSRAGEYVRFGDVTPGSSQVVRLEPGADVCFDPMRTFLGHERVTITLGFLSLLAGCSLHSEEGAALAEAVDAVCETPGSRLVDVLDELDRMGSDADKEDAPARSLARRLAHYRRSATGQLAFGDGDSLSLDADFIVFWAPSLALPDKETLSTTGGGVEVLLPEQIMAQALLYLVAAVGRKVVFNDPTRFAAALYDEAWALLSSPHGRSLLVEGVRDGRKHNGAIWLASQHPNDVAVGELADLLGSRFVFDQARRAVPAALELLGATGNDAAAVQLETGLDTGQCLFRDVRGRLGVVQILPPALAHLDDGFDTSPTAASQGRQAGADPAGEVEAARRPLEPPARDRQLPAPPPDDEDDEVEVAEADVAEVAEVAEAEVASAGASGVRRRRRPRRNPVAEALAQDGD